MILATRDKTRSIDHDEAPAATANRGGFGDHCSFKVMV